MPRFRTLKKSLKTKDSISKRGKCPKSHAFSSYKKISADIFLTRRLKALLVDIFMIYTPIVYIAYIILGSAQDFRQNQPVIFLCFLAYAAICSIFIAISSQTPGLRYVGLKLVRANSIQAESTAPTRHAKVGFLRALVRVFVWAFSYAIVIGAAYPFITRKHQCLHDIWLDTRLIDVSHENP